MKRLAITALLVATTPVHAAFYDGNNVYDFCQRQDSLAASWVVGFHDGNERAYWEARRITHGSDVRAVQSAERDIQRYVRAYCAPSDVSIRQMTDIFCSYLKSNAKTRHKPANELAAIAFAEAFPCPEPK